MKKILYVGLDVHKESIVVATALQGDTAVDLCGKIGGTLQAHDSGRTITISLSIIA
jgi:hypothetical protein